MYGYEMLSFTVHKRRRRGTPDCDYPDRNKIAQCKQGLDEGKPSEVPMGADHQNNLGASERPRFLGLASETAWSLEEQSGITAPQVIMP